MKNKNLAAKLKLEDRWYKISFDLASPIHLQKQLVIIIPWIGLSTIIKFKYLDNDSDHFLRQFSYFVGGRYLMEIIDKDFLRDLIKAIPNTIEIIEFDTKSNLERDDPSLKLRLEKEKLSMRTDNDSEVDWVDRIYGFDPSFINYYK